MMRHVTYPLKSVSDLKYSMFAAAYTNSTSGSPPGNLKEQDVWLLDLYGEFPKYNKDSKALNESEQHCCVFL